VVVLFIQFSILRPGLFELGIEFVDPFHPLLQQQFQPPDRPLLIFYLAPLAADGGPQGIIFSNQLELFSVGFGGRIAAILASRKFLCTFPRRQGSLATTSPVRVRQIQSYLLRLPASQRCASAQAIADSSAVPYNDISLTALLSTQALSIGTRVFGPAATNTCRNRMAFR
jgi:hypothetical protein